MMMILQFCVPILCSYSNDKSGYLESTDRERKEERQRGRLQDLGVF